MGLGFFQRPRGFPQAQDLFQRPRGFQRLSGFPKASRFFARFLGIFLVLNIKTYILCCLVELAFINSCYRMYVYYIQKP